MQFFVLPFFTTKAWFVLWRWKIVHFWSICFLLKKLWSLQLPPFPFLSNIQTFPFKHKRMSPLSVWSKKIIIKNNKKIKKNCTNWLDNMFFSKHLTFDNYQLDLCHFVGQQFAEEKLTTLQTNLFRPLSRQQRKKKNFQIRAKCLQKNYHDCFLSQSAPASLSCT